MDGGVDVEQGYMWMPDPGVECGEMRQRCWACETVTRLVPLVGGVDEVLYVVRRLHY